MNPHKKWSTQSNYLIVIYIMIDIKHYLKFVGNYDTFNLKFDEEIANILKGITNNK